VSAVNANTGLTPLSTEECHALLENHRPRLGRLAFADGGRPLVLPVNYVAEGRVLWFRTAPGSKLLAALRMQQVTFELDHVDPTWEQGWSVLAFGRLRMITDDDELEAARRLPLQPWAAGDRSHHLRLDIERVSGRRLV
jgi:nitroimidazol reductase NimA-like FMN-containing flavoprotein (pyridoxamine 5'-phosphate oxidase superfamily)